MAFLPSDGVASRFLSSKTLPSANRAFFNLNISKRISQPTKSAHRTEPNDLEETALPDF
jgi:hypothetical protein